MKKITIEDLVAGWSDEYKKLAAPAIKEIQRLLAAGDTPDSAVRKAFYKYGIDEKLASTLLTSATRAAEIGLGIPGAAAKQSARDKLERLPWTPDNMPLSQRLHGAGTTMRQKIIGEIDGALAKGSNWKAIAKNLYDGYGFPTTIGSAALPQYMDELLKASRTMDNGAELRAALRKANRQIKLLGQDDAPNQALKAAYKKIVRAVETGSDKAIDNAVRVGVEEKSRYHAERIARTEIARAWAEGFWAEHGPEELTVAVKWKLSSRHPIYDICDFHAHADLYGLGPGVYPKDRAPRLPAHPHCNCLFSPVFDGEVGQPDLDPQHVLRRGADFLRGLDDYERQRLLTIEGEKAWRAGDSWQNQLRNWQGHGDNRPRLTKEDFTLPAAAPVKTRTSQDIAADIKTLMRFKNDADLKGIPVDVAEEIEKCYAEIARRYPQLIGEFRGLGTGVKGASVYANCQVSTGEININPFYFGEKAKLLSKYEKDVRMAFHPENTTGFAIVTHEIAHAIDGYLSRNGFGTIKGWNMKDASVAIRTRALKELKLAKKHVQAGLSEYATKSDAEFFAEAFAEYIHSPAPRDIARKVGEITEEMLQNVTSKTGLP